MEENEKISFRKVLGKMPPYLLVLTMLCFSSLLFSPIDFWPSGFLVFTILPLLLLNFLLLISLIIIKSDTLLWPVIVIITGWYFVVNTLHLSFKGYDDRNPNDLEILTYDVGFFNSEEMTNMMSDDMINWIFNDSSDVKCIQEFQSIAYYGSYDISSIINENNYHSYIVNFDSSSLDTLKGMAIISKFPILNSGKIVLNEGTANNVIYADIEYMGKKIRIYNVHLAPIIVGNQDESKGFMSGFFGIFKKMGNGSTKRIKEIEELVLHTSKSPYPYLICGNFNETPYGYNYRALTKAYRSSFSEKAQGFGFSLNSNLFFLRIDHHLFSRDFEPLFYRVDREMNLSDHFPVRCVYRYVE